MLKKLRYWQSMASLISKNYHLFDELNILNNYISNHYNYNFLWLSPVWRVEDARCQTNWLPRILKLETLHHLGQKHDMIKRNTANPILTKSSRYLWLWWWWWWWCNSKITLAAITMTSSLAKRCPMQDLGFTGCQTGDGNGRKAVCSNLHNLLRTEIAGNISSFKIPAIHPLGLPSH